MQATVPRIRAKVICAIFINDWNHISTFGLFPMKCHTADTDIPRDSITTEYKTMSRAVTILFHQFPSIKRDVARANTDTELLISKIRKVCNVFMLICNYMCDYMRKSMRTLTLIDHRL